MRYFYIKITGGTSAGPYNIYYDSISSNNFATGFTTNTTSENVTYSALTTGLGYMVVVPNLSQSIILVNTTTSEECNPLVYNLSDPSEQLPDLCFAVTSGYLGEVTQYQFTLTDQTFNGRPVWSSSTYNIKWNSNNQYWYVEGWSKGFTSTNPAIPPISNWTIYGSTDTAVVYTGQCTTTPFKIKNINTTQSTCLNNNCSGSIEIISEGGTPPIYYSIDNGQTLTTTGLFNNLCPSTYSAYIVDSNNLISTQTVIITNNSTYTQYYVTVQSSIVNVAQGNNSSGLPFVTKKLNFNIRVSDSNNNTITQLPNGVQLTLGLSQTNLFDRTININSGTIDSTVVITKNNTPITLSTVTNTTSLPDTRPGCQSNLITRNLTQKNASINISGNDTISGSVTTTITKIGRTTCDLISSNDTVTIATATISGCNCCSVINNMNEGTMILTL